MNSSPSVGNQTGGASLPPAARKAANDRASRERRRAAARTPEQREALAVAEALEALASQHPAHARVLNASALQIRKEGLKTPDKVRAAIMRAMTTQGCHSIEDICDETGFSKKEVTTWIEGALATKQVYKTEKPSPAGPAVELYWLTGRASISPLVRP